jgi:imidazolonepropionase-like amidohydrolase
LVRSILGVLAAVLIAAPAAAATLYRHATVFESAAATMQPGQAILVDGERIAAAGPDAEVAAAAPKDARVVDLAGRFVLPGLIDSHEHLATPPNRRQAEASLRRDLFGGVTAVRDMADDLRSVAELARASRAGEIPAPDIYYAALMAGPSFFADPRTGAASFGVARGTAPWMQAIGPDTDLHDAVTLARGTSATAIKIYANLPADLVAKITAEAHRQHLKVWAHSAVYPATPSEGIAAGVDVVSHACGLAHEVAGTPATYQARTPIDPGPFLASDNPVMASLFRRMAARGILLDATTSIYHEADARRAADPKAKPALCSGALSDALLRQAWKAGVQISAGTDWVAPASDPWPTLHHELAALVKAGLPPAQVLRAATLNGARAAGQEADLGRIAPGHLADLIVTTRDPTLDIENLKSLVLTIKRGREYPRSAYRPPTADDFKDLD